MTHNQNQAQYSSRPQRPVQTLARAYAAIVEQTPPWVAINEFFHEWWDYSRTQHTLLITEEALPGGPSALLDTSRSDLPLPEHDRRWRWAVFCAAVADYLSEREGITPPAWVNDPGYTLAEPWYLVGNGEVGDAKEALPPGIRVHLEQTTPSALRRRNIFCSDRIFANKYEFTQQVKQLAAARAKQK